MTEEAKEEQERTQTKQVLKFINYRAHQADSTYRVFEIVEIFHFLCDFARFQFWDESGNYILCEL